MAHIIELVVSALIGWVPDRPRWARWLVIALYVAAVALAVIVAINALA